MNTKMRTHLRAALLGGLVVAAASSAEAGSVFMKNGYIIQGRIVERSDAGLTLGWPNGKVLIAQRFVESVLFEPGEEERLRQLERSREVDPGNDRIGSVLDETAEELPANLDLFLSKYNLDALRSVSDDPLEGRVGSDPGAVTVFDPADVVVDPLDVAVGDPEFVVDPVDVSVVEPADVGVVEPADVGVVDPVDVMDPIDVVDVGGVEPDSVVDPVDVFDPMDDPEGDDPEAVDPVEVASIETPSDPEGGVDSLEPAVEVRPLAGGEAVPNASVGVTITVPSGWAETSESGILAFVDSQSTEGRFPATFSVTRLERGGVSDDDYIAFAKELQAREFAGFQLEIEGPTQVGPKLGYEMIGRGTSRGRLAAVRQVLVFGETSVWLFSSFTDTENGAADREAILAAFDSVHFAASGSSPAE